MWHLYTPSTNFVQYLLFIGEGEAILNPFVLLREAHEAVHMIKGTEVVESSFSSFNRFAEQNQL
jgi:hypothetical protein